MTFPKATMLVQAAGLLTVFGLAISPSARAADTPPGTTAPPATAPCPGCPWGRGPGMMGPGMMWNMTPEQREEHWRYMHRHMPYGPYGRGMMGPRMMYGPWGGTPTPDTR